MAVYTQGRSWIPKTDIYETENHVVLQLDLPGVDSEQIDIQCDNGVLSVKGERKFDGDENERRYYRVEKIYGPFERYFEIPRTLDVEHVNAAYQDGVLTLSFPKTEAAKPRKITIREQ